MRHLYLHYLSTPERPLRQGVTADELRRLVETERAAGRRAASLEDPLEAGTFTISFDDAHRSMLEAADVLAALDVPATLFVPTGFVDTSDAFLTVDELRRLRERGWTIGAHSVSHPRFGWRLYDEDDAAWRARLERECRESRAQLEAWLGEPVALFASPYGEDPPAARDAARAAGFARAFTVRGSMDWDGDPLSIPRLDARAALGLDAPRSDEPTAISVVVPAYERAEILAEVVTRLASQSYPEERYEVLVVDDGSESDLGPIFAEMPANVRLLRPKGRDATFRAGQARQWGADQARFDTLAFLDADVAVGPDFLWHLDWVHRREEDAVVLGYLSGYNLHDLGHVHGLDDVRGRELDALNVIPDRSREPTLRACLDNLDWLEAPWELCYTGNLSLPKALLERVGGFADEFRGWGLEDVDLGARLHAAGARWVFSRWAFGAHLVDPSEPAPRNPFRKRAPARPDFAGYLENLALLEARHAGDAVMEAFARRSRADVDETCGRPSTVGVEMGGAASRRGRFFRRLHRVHPGGRPTMELVDRCAYAAKVGARVIYLLGGAPAEHPGFLAVLRAAKEAVSWVSMQTLVYPFATEGAASAAKEAGLDGVVMRIFALDAEAHEAVQGPRSWPTFEAGYEALRGSGLECAARVILTPETAEAFEATLARLKADGIAIDEVAITEPSLAERARAAGFDPVPAAP